MEMENDFIVKEINKIDSKIGQIFDNHHDMALNIEKCKILIENTAKRVDEISTKVNTLIDKETYSASSIQELKEFKISTYPIIQEVALQNKLYLFFTKNWQLSIFIIGIILFLFNQIPSEKVNLLLDYFLKRDD